MQDFLHPPTGSTWRKHTDAVCLSYMLIERQRRLLRFICSRRGQRGLSVSLKTGQGGKALPSPFRDPVFLQCAGRVCRLMSATHTTAYQMARNPRFCSTFTANAFGLWDFDDSGSKCHGLPQSTFSQHYSQHCQNVGNPQISRFSVKNWNPSFYI